MKQLNILCEERTFNAAIEKIICEYDVPGYCSVDALTLFVCGMSEKAPSGTYKLVIVPVKNEDVKNVCSRIKKKSEEIKEQHEVIFWVTPVEQIYIPKFTFPEHEAGTAAECKTEEP